MRDISRMLFEIGLASGRYTDPRSLSKHHGQVYSQNGEDGIIAEIFERTGMVDRFFVDIGAENGHQNNTRFLLEQGWRGVWVEGNADLVQQASTNFSHFIGSGSLKIIHQNITVANINQILTEAGVPLVFDFLSVDIDQNTGHVWEKMVYASRVACIEYNANIPPMLDLQAEYDAQKMWDGTNWYGSGLKALERIAKVKKMNLVGCELMGVNAFFVEARETAALFQPPFTAEMHYEPPRYEAISHGGHPPSAVARIWQRSGSTSA